MSEGLFKTVCIIFVTLTPLGAGVTYVVETLIDERQESAERERAKQARWIAGLKWAALRSLDRKEACAEQSEPDFEGGCETHVDLFTSHPERIGSSWQFGPYQCQGICAGHMAGYRWAKSHKYYDPDQCGGGQSQSFVEGCRVGVENMNDENAFVAGQTR